MLGNLEQPMLECAPKSNLRNNVEWPRPAEA